MAVMTRTRDPRINKVRDWRRRLYHTSDKGKQFTPEYFAAKYRGEGLEDDEPRKWQDKARANKLPARVEQREYPFS